MTYRALVLGFRVVEVPIVFRDRQAGKPKMDRSIVAEAIWRVPLLRSAAARRRPEYHVWTGALYFLKY